MPNAGGKNFTTGARSHSTSAIPIANAQPTPTSARPSRKAVLQFLWVGLAALIFALGWSVIATLKQFGLI